LDLQSRLLLALYARPGGRGHCIWLWLEHRTNPLRWQDLRRALYSRARVDADGIGHAGREPADPQSAPQP
ncbi:MAG TPA: hypothetical protein VGC24_11145, partial [Burkholderiaceae bacterium]